MFTIEPMIQIGFTLFFLAALVFLITFLSRSVYMVRQAEVIIIERLGRYSKTLGAGLHIVVPFLERPRRTWWNFIEQEDGKRYYRYSRMVERIDLRESVYDFPKQNVITRDNVTMEISAILYYQITDPKAAVYEVANLPEAIEKLTQTTLRNVIGSMDLDESLVSRDRINEKLRLILDEATDKWGVKVNRVELQEVNPPADIRHAMEKQMRAEREKREMILLAEGKKGSAILEAEGEREAAILSAEGRAQSHILGAEAEATSRLKIIEAEAKAIALIREQLPNGDPLPYLIAIQYVKALPEMMRGKNDKLIVVPYETAALTGSLASLKKIFTEVS